MTHNNIKMATILFIGENSKNSTASHRAEALIRIGHNVTVCNPKVAVEKEFNSGWLYKIHYRTGFAFLQSKIKRWLEGILTGVQNINLVWVDGGELIGVESLKLMKQLKCPIVLYNNDDPTGGRDGSRFNTLVKSIPFYDLCVVRRQVSVVEYENMGAKKVLNVILSYDEVQHQPFSSPDLIPDKFKSEVAFIGTWMANEKRDEFILELIKLQVPVSVWGDHWKKSPLFNQLKPYWRGPAIYNRDYVAGVQGSKICLGFLSKGNRDLHTRRSVEVPFIGSVLCAERTSEHEEMYIEGQEAVFWDNAAECAKLCLNLLSDDEKREKIKLAGMKKVREMNVGSQDLVKKIVDTALQLRSAH